MRRKPYVQCLGDHCRVAQSALDRQTLLEVSTPVRVIGHVHCQCREIIQHGCLRGRLPARARKVERLPYSDAARS